MDVVIVLLQKKELLSKMGFADSKKLTEKDRDKLFEKIDDCDFIGHFCIVLPPEEISQKMLRISKYNLNSISHDAALQLIQIVIQQKHIKLSEVFVDTVGDATKYRTKIANSFPQIPEITVTPKADSLFPIVSAASICAKVVRDFTIQNWKFKENCFFPTNFGSGYPSDPVTKKWLKNNGDLVFGFPSILRFSWKTSENLMKDSAVSVRWEVEDQDEAEFYKSKKRKKIVSKDNITDSGEVITPSMLKRKNQGRHIENRSSFFLERNIYHISNF